jgi:Flp pilus assembly protein TadD
VTALLAIACYANTLEGELFLDDRPAIVENVYVLDGDPVAIFTHPSWWGTQTKITTWRPLTTLSFAVNHALGGFDPRGYHVVNVLLHAAVSAIFLAVLGALVPWMTAVAAAVVFAVHPVHTEVVASVVGRAELLAALGFFAAWWCLLAADAARTRTPPRPARTLEAAGVVLFLTAMLAKENAIALLPVLIFTDIVRASPVGIGTTLRHRLPRYAALALAAVLFVTVRVRLSGELTPAIPPLDNPLVTLAAASRWMTAIAVAAYYALRLVFPLWLSADYTAWQIAPVTTPLDPRFAAGLAVLLAVLVGIWWGRERDQPTALGLGLMAIPFLLISNLVFLIATIMAERWIYLPSAGFCLVAGALLVRIVTGARAAPTRESWRRLAVPLAIVVVLLAVRTWTRNAVWRNPMAFFSTLVDTSPRSSLAHTGYADALTAAGRRAEALAEYERALAIAPGNWRAEYNRGNALLAGGDVAGAIAAYERALAIEPEFSKAIINLGAAESRRGNGAAAVAWLRRALVLEPNVPSVHTSLANVLAATGDRDGAHREFQTALALAPQSADVLADYGAFLAASGAHEDAIKLLRRSLALRPDVAERHYNLGNELALSGALDEAVAAYRQALSLRPKFPEALENLGSTESLRGNHAAALDWLRRAAATGAPSARLHTNIANELAHLDRGSEARTEYEAALALAPADPALRATYEAFLARQK